MPKKEMAWVKASGWLFVLGIIISIIAGLIYPLYSAEISGLLAVIGFIIGILGIAGVSSIDKADVNMFLLAVVALMIAGSSGAALSNIGAGTPFSFIGAYLSYIVGYIAVLVIPATVLIALRAIWQAGSTKF